MTPKRSTAEPPIIGATLDDVRAWITHSDRILFITGAGVSAESGLPTYRGVGGIYGDQPTDEGFSIEQALSGPMLEARPEITWKYIQQIEQACRGAKPNRAHEIIAQLQSNHDVWVLTQNVDGLHAAAGSSNIIDIHGDVRQLACMGCSWRRHVESYEGLPALPRCDCGAVLRPEVVLFEEMLPPAKLGLLADQMQQGFDLVVSIGTSSLFPYIAAPVIEAARRNIPTVEINPVDTNLSSWVAAKISAGAVAAMTALVP